MTYPKGGPGCGIPGPNGPGPNGPGPDIIVGPPWGPLSSSWGPESVWRKLESCDELATISGEPSM